MLQNRVQVGLGDQHQVFGRLKAASVIVIRHQAHGAHFDLPFRLLAGDIQHRASFVMGARELGSHLNRHLQHQRRFANARVAAHQHDRTRHHPAAQHACKFRDWQRQALFSLAGNVIQPAWLRPSPQPARCSGCQRRFFLYDLLDHGAVLAARRTAPQLPGHAAPAVLAHEARLCFYHGAIIPLPHSIPSFKMLI